MYLLFVRPYQNWNHVILDTLLFAGAETPTPLLLRITTMVVLGVFWLHFCRQNFVAAFHTKVAIHSLSLSPLSSCHVSKVKQQSNSCPTRKEGVLPELQCPSELELSNHTREPSPHVLHVPLLFGKDTFIYMHVCICFD
jgi:hypothetical protein